MTKTHDKKVALITGITGQDGSYLTEFLLEKGYTVSFVLVIIYLYVCLYVYVFFSWVGPDNEEVCNRVLER